MQNFEPLNRKEDLLYAQLLRLDALVDMMSSFVKIYADKNGLATENVKEELKLETITELVEQVEVIEEVKPKARKKPVKK